MGGNAGIASSVAQWAAQPFKSDMSVSGWALFLGLLIVIVILWNKVIGEIVEIA